MIVPQFIFDDEANANISEAFTITRQGLVHIELGSRAQVVILRQEGDGGYANYGQTPTSGDKFEINITCKDEISVKLATPVDVTKCYILN